MRILLALALLVCTALAAQQIPAPTELPGDPFFIKSTWRMPSNGDILNGMVLDLSRLQILLAYRSGVVVEDMKSGAVTSGISGPRGASGIALDSTGEFGFIADGPFSAIDVFDRRTLRVVGFIPTCVNPSMVAFEPTSALLFAFCGETVPEKPISPQLPSRASSRSAASSSAAGMRAPASKPATNPETAWFITVIDANTWSALGDIKLEGRVAFVQTAGNSHVYISLQKMGGIIRVECDALADKLRNTAANSHTSSGPTPKEEQLRTGPPFLPVPLSRRSAPPMLDWSKEHIPSAIRAGDIVFLRLNPACGDSRAAAVDERHMRVFLACDNMTLAVLNADNGDQIASLPTGPDTRAVAYDFDRRLIFAANAGGNGSLTVIRQHATDSYAVVQNLPTPHLARALAVDPSTGLAYVVTDYRDLDSKQPQPTKGNFQISVIGH